MPWSSWRRVVSVSLAVAAALAIWFWERRGGAPSLGVFTFISPPLIAGVWLTSSTRADVRADGKSLSRVFVILVAAGVLPLVAMGMRPSIAPTLAAAALQLAVLAPLLVGARIAGAGLRRRWAERRLGGVGAMLLGDAAPALIWLPVFMLAHEVHRAQGRVEPADIGVDWPSERVVFRGAHGTRLVGLWFGHPEPRGAVLLIHGIGADKAQFLWNTEILYRRGYDVFAYDQRNHGESGGLTSTLGAVEADDAVEAWAVLRARTRGARIPRVVMGVSMGGAAAQLAVPRLVGLDGLILDSTFADIDHVAARRLPLGPLTGAALAVARTFAVALTGHAVLDVAPVRSAASAPRGLPVLLLHGRADPLVPFGEAEALARAYGARATLVPLDGPGHAQGLLHDGPRYEAALVHFADTMASRAE